jgi:hypothetical protein
MVSPCLSGGKLLSPAAPLRPAERLTLPVNVGPWSRATGPGVGRARHLVRRIKSGVVLAQAKERPVEAAIERARLGFTVVLPIYDRTGLS